MTFEVITNPESTIATVLILLIAVTAIAFLAVLILCGIRTEDIEEAEDA